AAGLVNLARPAEDRDTVPAALAMPNRLVTGIADRLFRKPLLRSLQLLKTHDVGFGEFEPAQEHREPAVYSVHIVGRDLQSLGALLQRRFSILPTGRHSGNSRSPKTFSRQQEEKRHVQTRTHRYWHRQALRSPRRERPVRGIG